MFFDKKVSEKKKKNGCLTFLLPCRSLTSSAKIRVNIRINKVPEHHADALFDSRGHRSVFSALTKKSDFADFSLKNL